jgi:hypothetical protein
MMGTYKIMMGKIVLGTYKIMMGKILMGTYKIMMGKIVLGIQNYDKQNCAIVESPRREMYHMGIKICKNVLSAHYIALIRAI